MRASARTWFGTITLRPDAHYRFLCEAMQQQRFKDITPNTDEEFIARHWAISRELTKAIKRLRKKIGAKAAFRYLLVTEVHKSGLPHYHILLHETSVHVPIRKRMLEEFWPHGFCQFRLAKPAHASYVAKYVSKSPLARVRASQRYGLTEGHGEPISVTASGHSRAEPSVKPMPPLKQTSVDVLNKDALT